MFIAHLPAGYIASRLLVSRYLRYGVDRTRFLWAGACGAIAPDADLLYFYVFDHRQHHHHAYVTHFPIVWACLVLLSLLWLYAGRMKAKAALAFIFALNGLIHMVLDTVVGDIWWSAPFGGQAFSLFTVPATHKPWWLNFILHWSFALEWAIVLSAVYLASKGKKQQRASAPMPRSEAR